MTAPYQERTAPFLRPNEVALREEELGRIKTLINDQPYIRAQVANMGAMVRRRNAIQEDLAKNTPRPYEPFEKDAANARERELRAQFTPDMPTQREMRRCPPGAPDKHLAFEKKHKGAILEWKNIRRRQQASGMFGADDISCANIELFRKNSAHSELSMDNALIKGKQIHLPPAIEVKNLMSDEEREQVALERLAMKIAAGDAATIEAVRALLKDTPSPTVCNPPQRPKLSAAQRARLAERMRAMNERRYPKKATVAFNPDELPERV